jgi:hypothetical protein
VQALWALWTNFLAFYAKNPTAKILNLYGEKGNANCENSLNAQPPAASPSGSLFLPIEKVGQAILFKKIPETVRGLLKY